MRSKVENECVKRSHVTSNRKQGEAKSTLTATGTKGPQVVNGPSATSAGFLFVPLYLLEHIIAEMTRKVKEETSWDGPPAVLPLYSESSVKQEEEEMSNQQHSQNSTPQPRRNSNADLMQQIVSLRDQVNDLQHRQTTLESNLASFNSTHLSNVSAINANIDGVNSNINAVNSNINAVNSNIDGLQSEVTSLRQVMTQRLDQMQNFMSNDLPSMLRNFCASRGQPEEQQQGYQIQWQQQQQQAQHQEQQQHQPPNQQLPHQHRDSY